MKCVFALGFALTICTVTGGAEAGTWKLQGRMNKARVQLKNPKVLTVLGDHVAARFTSKAAKAFADALKKAPTANAKEYNTDDPAGPGFLRHEKTASGERNLWVNPFAGSVQVQTQVNTSNALERKFVTRKVTFNDRRLVWEKETAITAKDSAFVKTRETKQHSETRVLGRWLRLESDYVASTQIDSRSGKETTTVDKNHGYVVINGFRIPHLGRAIPAHHKKGTKVTKE